MYLNSHIWYLVLKLNLPDEWSESGYTPFSYFVCVGVVINNFFWVQEVPHHLLDILHPSEGCCPVGSTYSIHSL